MTLLVSENFVDNDERQILVKSLVIFWKLKPFKRNILDSPNYE